jgi:hypothetical protein
MTIQNHESLVQSTFELYDSVISFKLVVSCYFCSLGLETRYRRREAMRLALQWIVDTLYGSHNMEQKQ